MSNSRRDLLKAFLIASFGAVLPLNLVEAAVSECSSRELGLRVESNESPFFEHYHQIEIPVAALITIPKDGIVVKTSAVDQGSFDVSGFAKFIKQSGLNKAALQSHDHPVQLSANQLSRIAAGERDVEVRVISKSGNYVHNFLVTASPMILAKIRKGKK